MTPHLEASPGDYSSTVLLPGDPNRAQWFADTFLEAPRCVNRVRGALGFTGFYRGMRVSIQTSCMGRPALAIYLHDLVTVYGVRTVIRTGTCGGLQEDIAVRELFVAETAILEADLGSAVAADQPDPVLLEAARVQAARLAVPTRFGAMLCSDEFYHPKPEGRFDPARAAGKQVVDMETSGLFSMSRNLNVRALSICTVVDNPITGAETAMSERQALFGNMATLALEVAVAAA